MHRLLAAAVLSGAVAGALAGLTAPILAQSGNGSIYVQCPGDTNGDAIPDVASAGPPEREVHAPGGG